jgi:DNA-binding GntR family transcriptional regulator
VLLQGLGLHGGNGRSAPPGRAGEIYRTLRDELVSCEISPGSALSEQKLAARFESSKTPVREALQRLCNEGLVAVYPRRGYAASPITVTDIGEVFELRRLVEPYAAARAAANATTEQLAELTQLCDRLSDPDIEPRRRRQAHSRFHIAIAEASNNWRLVGTIAELQADAHRLLAFFDLASAEELPTRRSHIPLLKALSERDEVQAADLCRESIDSTLSALKLAVISWLPGTSFDGVDAKGEA